MFRVRKIYVVSLSMILCAAQRTTPATATVWDVRNVAQLNRAMANLQDNDTVIIQPGTYNLNHGFYVRQSGITIQGATGNRNEVILGGGGMNNSSDVSLYEGISLLGADSTVKDLTLEEFYHHALHFQPGADRTLIQNVITRNIGEQHMKGSPLTTGGIIENSLLEQTYTRTNDGVARPDNYLGGIDLIGADNWIIRDNVIRDIEGIQGGGPGILLWQDITNCTIERNVVIGSAAGLHLGNTSRPNGAEDCIVRNNFLVATSDDDDALMAFAFTKNVRAYNNTVYGGVPGGTYWFTMVHVYDNASVPTENLDLRNNLIRGRVWDRATGDWSSSAVEAMGNLVDVTGRIVLPDWFNDSLAGDLHLTDLATGAIGQGTVVADALYDFDREFRGNVGDPTDLGADLHIIPVPATVVLRGVFYNNSAFDADDAKNSTFDANRPSWDRGTYTTSGKAAGEQDGDALAPDKEALLPGYGATFENYTSYDKGINGIMIDVTGLVGTPTAADFEFKVGNDDTPHDWEQAPAPTSVTLRPGEGVDNSDRVTIVWPDHAIENQWLQVTVLATRNTGLAERDVFYFGNAIGESGNSTTDAKVNVYDMLAARDNPRTFLDPAPIDFFADFNRDQRVNAYDMLIARDNQTSFLDDLELITVPGAKAVVPEPSTLALLAMGAAGFLACAWRKGHRR